MSKASKNTDHHDPNLISKILNSTKELMDALANLFKEAKGPFARVLIFSSVSWLFLFVLLLVIIILYRQVLTPHLFVSLIFGLCAFFLAGSILTLVILKKYFEDLGTHRDSGSESLEMNPKKGIEVEREPLHEIMKSAKRCILISGHTLRKFTKEARRDKVKNALNVLWGRGVYVTLIFLHPESPYAEAQQPFHREESTEIQKEQEKYKNQIKEAIEYCIDKGRDQANCCVYLSYYKPPFRTIVIDHPEFCSSSEPSTDGVEPKCYIDLYMYGVDVEKTPRIMFPKESQGYKEIVNSINKLRSSCHLFPLVEKGKINEDWKDRGLFHLLNVCTERECHKRCKRLDSVSSALLGNQNPGRSHAGIYSKDYKAGTFTLRQFEQNFDQYEHLLVENGESSFEEWLDRAVREEFSDLKDKSTGRSGKTFSKYDDEGKKKEIIEKVKAAFGIGPSSFDLLEQICCQEYSDVIRRMILTYVLGNPDCEVEICGDLTSPKTKDMILKVIEYLSIDYAALRNEEQIWLDLSVIAGLLGLNIKPNRTATSVINHSIGINIIKDENPLTAASRIAKELKKIQAKKSLNGSIIDDSEKFFKILEGAGEITLVSFPDDCLETLFLLKYYDFLIDKYKSKLKIHIIPRSVRCGNDVVTSDIYEVLDYFPNLKNSNHFVVVENGPKIGGVNLKRIHGDVVQEIEKADLIDVRGARNYEMMQRVSKKAFFGFMVARRISEAVTGLVQSRDSYFYCFQERNTCSFRDDWEESLQKKG